MIKRWTAAIMITTGVFLGAQGACRNDNDSPPRTLSVGQPLPEDIQEQLRGAGWDLRIGDKYGIWVSAARQQLIGIDCGRVEFMFACSTAAKGLGNKANSYQTPTGWHEIQQRIGDGAAWGAIFVERKPTGKIWDPKQPTEKDYVLTRILWLKGLESGVNLGGGVDSYDRYIYIHGTPAEQKLGSPASWGCVRLSNTDVIKLFDRTPVGTKVLITPW